MKHESHIILVGFRNLPLAVRELALAGLKEFFRAIAKPLEPPQKMGRVQDRIYADKEYILQDTIQPAKFEDIHPMR